MAKDRPEITTGSKVVVCIFHGNRVEITVWSRDDKYIYFTDPTGIYNPKRLLSRRLNGTDVIEFIKSK